MARPGIRLWPQNRQRTQAKKEEQCNKGIFDDKPVDQQIDDHLKVDHLVNSLAGLIKKQCTSLTIGIYGEWGSGKTSFLQLLKERLQKNDIGIYPIWFNAWKYDKKDNLWSALIQTILNRRACKALRSLSASTTWPVFTTARASMRKPCLCSNAPYPFENKRWTRTTR